MGINDLYRAFLNAHLGETDQAFQYLERAFEQKLTGTSFLGFWPIWDPIRNDPRFEALIARLNLPPPPSG